MDDLVRARVLSRVKANDDKDEVYQPARPPARLTISLVLGALAETGTDAIPVAESETREKLAAGLKAFSNLAEQSPDNLLLKDM